MPEVQKGLFVSENLLEENRALYYKRQQERREAKKRLKQRLKPNWKKLTEPAKKNVNVFGSFDHLSMSKIQSNPN